MELGPVKSRTTARGPAGPHGRPTGDEAAAPRRRVHATLALLGSEAPEPPNEAPAPQARLVSPPDERARAAADRGAGVLRIELVLDERMLRELGRAISTVYDVVLSLAPGRAEGEAAPGPITAPAAVAPALAYPTDRGSESDGREHADAVARGESIVIGDLRVDFGAHVVWRAGRRVALRPREFALLRALIRANGRAVSRECLLREVWGYTEGVLSRTLDTHVRSLRRKLEAHPAAPRHLLTVRTVGYRFAP